MIARSQAYIVLAATLAAAVVSNSALADPLPKRVGQCGNTSIVEVGERLQGSGRGSAVRYENGGTQVGYDPAPGLAHSKDGDPVRICLVSIPRHCPKGDDRGRIYETTNLRTHEKWKMSDSSHSCGGA